VVMFGFPETCRASDSDDYWGVFFFKGDHQCSTPYQLLTGCTIHQPKATKPTGSKNGAEPIGEHAFVRGDKGIDDAQARDLQPVVHVL
jgi:hypothetical protein